MGRWRDFIIETMTPLQCFSSFFLCSLSASRFNGIYVAVDAKFYQNNYINACDNRKLIWFYRGCAILEAYSTRKICETKVMMEHRNIQFHQFNESCVVPHFLSRTNARKEILVLILCSPNNLGENLESISI